MGTTLTNGVYLPNEGERNCYNGLKTNWEILDQKVADVTALQQAVAGALHREIVESLPTTDIDPNTIYMILSGTSATENVYNEFMYVSNNWELIGTSATDLTNYYTKSEVDGKLLLKASASDLTSHTGDTTIHVTANDKSKWNTVALIKQLRLVNAQVGSATTIAFSNIDDTNGIKVGDKCMDLDAKMFEITAVDTTNQTVTVGSALIDLALDGNVVHTSGNETVGGTKTFTSTTGIYNSDTSGSTANLYFRNQLVTKGDTSSLGNQTIRFSDASDKMLGRIQSAKVSNGSSTLNLRADTIDTNNVDVTVEVQVIAQKDGNKSCSPQSDNAIDLGRSLAKWKNLYINQINSLTPSSLSMPDIDNRIDISSYITDLTGVNNEYTPTVNGWICVRSGNATKISILDSATNIGNQSVSSTATYLTVMAPCIANKKVYINIVCTSLSHAYFIPCQGNV